MPGIPLDGGLGLCNFEVNPFLYASPLTTDAAQGPEPDSGYLVPDDETFVDADGPHELPGRFSQLLPRSR